MQLNNLQTNQSLGVAGPIWPNSTYNITLIYLSEANIYMHKIQDSFLPETLMLKESCNLIEQQYMLPNHLKAYVIHNKNKIFPSNSINLPFWITCGNTTLKPTKSTPGKSKHLLPWLGIPSHIHSAIVIIQAIFPCLLSLCRKCKALHASMQKSWW